MNKTLLNAIKLLKNVISNGGTPEEISRAALYFVMCDECANNHDRSYDSNNIKELAEKYFDIKNDIDTYEISNTVENLKSNG